LEHFKTFVEYFETIDAYERARSESDTKQVKVLETKLLENADVYAGLASIFKNGERQEVRVKLSQIEPVVDSILSGTSPSKVKVEESLTTLKELRRQVEERTSDDEKTAERMIYGSIPTF